MALSGKDITKIAELLKHNTQELLEKVFTKKDGEKLEQRISNVEDDVAEIKQELKTEHELRYKRVENNSKRIETIEKHLKLSSQDYI